MEMLTRPSAVSEILVKISSAEYCKTNRKSEHAFPSHLDLCRALHISLYTPAVAVSQTRPLLAPPPMYCLTYYRRRSHHYCPPVLQGRPVQLLGQMLQRYRLKAAASMPVVVCFACHQSANMVVDDSAVEKRGSVGGEKLKAGSCGRVFCYPTFLMTLGCGNDSSLRLDCNAMVIAIVRAPHTGCWAELNIVKDICR